MSEIMNKYDFVLLFDVKDGNPNGDPDAGNLPRVDAETGKGLVTDVCLKRKIRNYVQLTKGNDSGYDIFIKEKAILNQLIDEAYEQDEVKKEGNAGKKVEAARNWMCRNYFDVRSFGAVMSTGQNAGQVRGPVQITFARSIDVIVASEHSITRMAVTTDKDAEKQKGDNRTMGRKFTVPYGLYRAHGFISSHLAAQTGFDESDLKTFWDSVINMFEHDHSAARGMMSVRELIVFKHDSPLGNAPSHKLFELIDIKRTQRNSPARDFKDYIVSIDEVSLPAGVELIRMV